MDDYIDAAASLAWVRETYPEATLQPTDPLRPFWVETIKDRDFIVYSASLYRTPDDPRPGIATAWEPFPGLTPYTKGSELMNAETSAWARACRAVMMPTKKIASKEEVRQAKERIESWSAADKSPEMDGWSTVTSQHSHGRNPQTGSDPECKHGTMKWWAPKDKPDAGAYYCPLPKDAADKCERVKA